MCFSLHTPHRTRTNMRYSQIPPGKIPFPQVTTQDYLKNATQEILELLKNPKKTCITISSTTKRAFWRHCNHQTTSAPSFYQANYISLCQTPYSFTYDHLFSNSMHATSVTYSTCTYTYSTRPQISTIITCNIFKGETCAITKGAILTHHWSHTVTLFLFPLSQTTHKSHFISESI